MIVPADLCAYALNAVGGGYCYGSSGEVCTLARRQMWATWNPSQQANLLGPCAKWDGKRVWDCSGLFRGAWRTLLSYRSGGATTIFNTWCTRTGSLATMPDVPGLAVFRGEGKAMAHIGLYVGNGQVVDARGSQKGVLKGKLSDYGWTHWGELADVAYGTAGEDAQAGTPAGETSGGDAPYFARVKTRTGNGIGLWSRTNTDSTRFIKVPEHAQVEVLEAIDMGWVRARYAQTMGYADGQYLVRV